MSQTGLGIYFLLILEEVRPFHGSPQVEQLQLWVSTLVCKWLTTYRSRNV